MNTQRHFVDRFFPGPEPPSPDSESALVLIGNFDGVHRGHQTVLANAAVTARQRGLRPVVLTFEPHPAEVLGRTPPPTLTTLPRKVELIQRVAPEIDVAVARFDPAFAAQTPEQFVRRLLVGDLGARAVVVGETFRFGRQRSGDFMELVRLGRELGFEAHAHEVVGDEGGPWSSTRARAAIAAGDVEEATRLLGRPHMSRGSVIHGDRRGRAIGFPTCNIERGQEMLPPYGVYAVLVDREGEGDDGGPRALGRGAANLGVRPTVAGAGAAPLLEVHLLDWTGDLYGVSLRVHFAARLRGEQRFAGLDELKQQIARDVADARRLLADATPDPRAGGAWA